VTAEPDPPPPPARLRLALFQPDRPHGLGMALRMGACLGVGIDVVEPCGFPLDDRRIRSGALDYVGRADWARHADLAAFRAFLARGQRRLVLLSTRAELPYHRAAYRRGDVLLLGRESAGVPEAVHEAADLRVRVPLRPGLRSLNVALAAAVVLGEALRQTGGLGEDLTAGPAEGR
jgi:tRNA (cytidine/uridine-2'-O-)-methyltransferase